MKKIIVFFSGKNDKCSRLISSTMSKLHQQTLKLNVEFINLDKKNLEKTLKEFKENQINLQKIYLFSDFVDSKKLIEDYYSYVPIEIYTYETFYDENNQPKVRSWQKEKNVYTFIDSLNNDYYLSSGVRYVYFIENNEVIEDIKSIEQLKDLTENKHYFS